MGYIWQNKDWPGFEYDSSLVSEKILLIEKEREKTDYAYSIIDRKTEKTILLRAVTEDTVSSLSIEGEKIDYQEVYSSLAKHLALECDGYRVSPYAESVLCSVFDGLENHDKMTHERLFEWNRRLFINKAGIKPKTIGCYRTSTEYVMRYRKMESEVVYEAVPADVVYSEMDKLLEYINTDDDTNPFLKAAVVSLWFVLIHPFEDGNGRISRTLADYVTARFSGGNGIYKISPIILRRKSEYYEKIENVSKGETMDITEWVIWFLSVVGEAIAGAGEILKKTLAVSSFMKSLDPNEYNSRQMSMLYRLADGSFYGKLTTEKWAKMMKCSSTVAYRDIQHLVKRGFLIPSGDGGRNTGYYFNEDNTSFQV